MKYLLAGILGPLFWLLVLSTALWLARRYCPRAEAILFSSPLTALKKLVQAIRERRRPAA